jgi:hypothetical protein
MVFKTFFVTSPGSRPAGNAMKRTGAEVGERELRSRIRFPKSLFALARISKEMFYFA